MRGQRPAGVEQTRQGRSRVHLVWHGARVEQHKPPTNLPRRHAEVVGSQHHCWQRTQCRACQARPQVDGDLRTRGRGATGSICAATTPSSCSGAVCPPPSCSYRRTQPPCSGTHRRLRYSNAVRRRSMLRDPTCRPRPISPARARRRREGKVEVKRGLRWQVTHVALLRLRTLIISRPWSPEVWRIIQVFHIPDAREFDVSGCGPKFLRLEAACSLEPQPLLQRHKVDCGNSKRRRRCCAMPGRYLAPDPL
jgi:hypothetical protein